MSLAQNITESIYKYCNNHLPSKEWYEEQFDFIEDEHLKQRLIKEFTAIRFAYKLYEGIQATKENYMFQIRYQIFAYATLYEAILDYVIFHYYHDNEHIKKIRYLETIKQISIPSDKMAILSQLEHDGKKIIACYRGKKSIDYSKIKFESKCNAAINIGLIKKCTDGQGKECDLPKDIASIYSIRNGIHILAEQKKNIDYEIELSKTAYRRMKPFIEQIKNKLKADKKGIYK